MHVYAVRIKDPEDARIHTHAYIYTYYPSLNKKNTAALLHNRRTLLSVRGLETCMLTVRNLAELLTGRKVLAGARHAEAMPMSSDMTIERTMVGEERQALQRRHWPTKRKWCRTQD